MNNENRGGPDLPSHIGRPRYDEAEVQRRRNITLSDKLAERAKQATGRNNLSEAIRVLIQGTE